jgi:threonine dehydrogenase-like Zn-dependent dehydrogenase
VEFIKKGDLCSAPFSIGCGRCRMCKTGNTGVCLNVNPDWNLLPFPDKERSMENILDLTMLPDIFPTGYHGACTAGVTSGSTVYVAGAGPVGPAAAHSATGRCPVMKYHHGPMQMILNDKAQIAKAGNATVITLDEAPKGYKDFDQGAAKKFVLNPHGPDQGLTNSNPM